MLATFLEWLLGICNAILKRESAKQLETNRQHNQDAEDARKDFTLQQTESRELRKDYADLMKTYQKMALEMEEKLEQLQGKFELLESAFEKEKLEHRECRTKLAALESQLKQLKGRVDVIQEKQGDDNAGS